MRSKKNQKLSNILTIGRQNSQKNLIDQTSPIANVKQRSSPTPGSLSKTAQDDSRLTLDKQFSDFQIFKNPDIKLIQVQDLSPDHRENDINTASQAQKADNSETLSLTSSSLEVSERKNVEKRLSTSFPIDYRRSTISQHNMFSQRFRQKQSMSTVSSKNPKLFILEREEEEIEINQVKLPIFKVEKHSPSSPFRPKQEFKINLVPCLRCDDTVKVISIEELEEFSLNPDDQNHGDVVVVPLRLYHSQNFEEMPNKNDLFKQWKKENPKLINYDYNSSYIGDSMLEEADQIDLIDQLSQDENQNEDDPKEIEKKVKIEAMNNTLLKRLNTLRGDQIKDTNSEENQEEPKGPIASDESYNFSDEDNAPGRKFESSSDSIVTEQSVVITDDEDFKIKQRVKNQIFGSKYRPMLRKRNRDFINKILLFDFKNRKIQRAQPEKSYQQQQKRKSILEFYKRTELMRFGTMKRGKTMGELPIWKKKVRIHKAFTVLEQRLPLNKYIDRKKFQDYDVLRGLKKIKIHRRMKKRMDSQKQQKEVFNSILGSKNILSQFRKQVQGPQPEKLEIIEYGGSGTINSGDNNVDADMMNPKNLQAISDARLIHPNGYFAKSWQLLTLFALLYCATLMPYKVCFLSDMSENSRINWIMFDTLIDFIFIFDIIVVCNTPYIDSKTKMVVLSRKQIFCNYLRGWLIVDILSSIPMDIIEYLIIPDQTDASFNNDVLKLIKIPRIYRILRVARIYRIIKLFKNMTIFNHLKDYLNLRVGSQRLIQFIITTFIMVHIVACFWYFITTIEDQETETWVSEMNVGEQDAGTIYIASLYWAYTTMLTVGYGDITAQTNSELIFSIIWMFLGAGIYTQVIGNLASVLASIDTKESTIQDRISTIDEFCRESKIDPELRAKLKHCVEYSTQKNFFSWSDKQQIFQELPSSIRSEISLHMHEGIVKTINFFKDKDSTFIGLIVPLLQPCHANEGDLIYSAGIHASNIFFISKGRASFCINDQLNIGYLDMIVGSYFGEIEIIRQCPRLFSVKAAINSDFLCLSKQIFENYVVDEFGDIFDEMEKVAILRQEKISVAQKFALETIQKIQEHDISKLSENELTNLMEAQILQQIISTEVNEKSQIEMQTLADQFLTIQGQSPKVQRVNKLSAVGRKSSNLSGSFRQTIDIEPVPEQLSSESSSSSSSSNEKLPSITQIDPKIQALFNRSAGLRGKRFKSEIVDPKKIRRLSVMNNQASLFERAQIKNMIDQQEEKNQKEQQKLNQMKSQIKQKVAEFKKLLNREQSNLQQTKKSTIEEDVHRKTFQSTTVLPSSLHQKHEQEQKAQGNRNRNTIFGLGQSQKGPGLLNITPQKTFKTGIPKEAMMIMNDLDEMIIKEREESIKSALANGIRQGIKQNNSQEYKLCRLRSLLNKTIQYVAQQANADVLQPGKPQFLSPSKKMSSSCSLATSYNSEFQIDKLIKVKDQLYDFTREQKSIELKAEQMEDDLDKILENLKQRQIEVEYEEEQSESGSISIDTNEDRKYEKMNTQKTQGSEYLTSENIFKSYTQFQKQTESDQKNSSRKNQGSKNSKSRNSKNSRNSRSNSRNNNNQNQSSTFQSQNNFNINIQLTMINNNNQN